MHYREIRFWENEAEFGEAPYSGDFRKRYYKPVKTPLQRWRAAGHSQGVSRRAAGTDSAKDLWLGVRKPPGTGPPPPVARARLPSRVRRRRIPRRHSAAERIFRSRRVPEKARERPHSRVLRSSALLVRAQHITAAFSARWNRGTISPFPRWAFQRDRRNGYNPA